MSNEAKRSAPAQMPATEHLSVRPDDGHPADLVRAEPADVHEGLSTGPWELQAQVRDVGVPTAHVVVGPDRRGHRHLVQHEGDDRDVVRGEVPHHVDVALVAAQA